MTTDERRMEALKVALTHIPVVVPSDRGDIRATLAQVSKEWYKFIRDNPQFMASISVRSDVAGVDTRLQRVVSIIPAHEPLALTVDIGTVSTRFNVITRLVEPYAERLRALDIELNDRTEFLQLMTITGAFPILEKIAIRPKRRFIPVLQDPDYDRTASLTLSPSLTGFTLDYNQSSRDWRRLDPARFLLPWTQLTELFFPELTLTLQSFFAIILQATSLVSTEFKILFGQRVDHPVIQPVQMAKLIKARLTFVGEQSPDDVQALGLLSFPLLNTLRLRLPLHTLAPFPDLKTQASNLKVVTINNTDTGPPKVYTTFPTNLDHTGFLQSLPRGLVHLEWLHSPLPSDTLASLALGSLFPSLTHLSVLEVQGPVQVITTMASRLAYFPLVFESSHGGEEIAHLDEAGDTQFGAFTHARDDELLSPGVALPITSLPSPSSPSALASLSAAGVGQAAGVSALRALVLVTTHESAGSVSSTVRELNLPRASDARLAPVIRVVY